MADACGGQESIDHLKLELQMVTSHYMGAETKLKSSARIHLCLASFPFAFMVTKKWE